MIEEIMDAIHKKQGGGPRVIRVVMNRATAVQVAVEINSQLLLASAGSGQPVYQLCGDLNGALLYGAFIEVDERVNGWKIVDEARE